MTLPSKVCWDRLFENLEFDLVSGLSLSKALFYEKFYVKLTYLEQE